MNIPSYQCCDYCVEPAIAKYGTSYLCKGHDAIRKMRDEQQAQQFKDVLDELEKKPTRIE